MKPSPAGSLTTFCTAVLCAACAAARPETVIEAAWSEAHRRAELQAPIAPPPEVAFSRSDVFQECGDKPPASSPPPAVYLSDIDRVEIHSLCQAPLHTLLVHEFLHAIRERERRRQGRFLEGPEPGEEEWVQERASRSSSAPIVPSTSRR